MLYDADEIFGDSEEQAPEVMGAKEVVGDEIIAEKSYYSNPFMFSVSWLNDYSKTVFKHCTSGYLQIQVKMLQNLSYLINYGGYHTPAFYILDVCPSGTGKSENIKIQSSLLLNPIYEAQKVKLDYDIARYEADRSVAKGKDKEMVKPPKLYRCIHANDTSKEALFESFETTKSQLVEFGELGLRLKKPDPVIDFIVDAFGKRTITAPNYKNQRFSSTIKVDDCTLFFIGDTSLQYLGTKTFYNHLQGGLINRCLIVYDAYIPAYEELPSIYKVDEVAIREINSKAKSLIEFASYHKDRWVDNSYTQNPALKAYEQALHDDKKHILETRNIEGNLYNRSIQNLRAIIEVLHFVRCYDRGSYSPVVEQSTIEEGISFCKRYFQFDGLLSELNGTLAEMSKDALADKVKQLLLEKKLPYKMRDVYRKFNISKKQLKEILVEMDAKFDLQNILSLKV